MSEGIKEMKKTLRKKRPGGNRNKGRKEDRKAKVKQGHKNLKNGRKEEGKGGRKERGKEGRMEGRSKDRKDGRVQRQNEANINKKKQE